MLPTIAAGLVALTSVFLLIVKDWRISLSILGIQYTCVFMLVGMNWPITLAITQLIAGWISGAILGMAILNISETTNNHPLFYEPRQTLSSIFYILAGILVGLAATSAAPSLSHWIPGIDIRQTWAGLILMGMGTLRLGFTSYPLSATCGLFTLVSGIEVIYAPMDSSPFTVGLFAVTMLGLAITGSYLFIAPHLEEKE
jgi:hydrogenase-4 membrane subunit HyfE